MDGGLEEWAGRGLPARARGRACRGSLGRCCCARRCSALLAPASAAAAPGASSRVGELRPRRSTSTAPPRDTSRLFVVERGGTHPGRARRRRRSATPFLDISGDVDHDGRARPALDRLRRPTTRRPGCSTSTWSRASRRASSRSASTGARPRTPTRADPTGRIVCRATHNEAANHNGGQIEFGPGRLPVVRDRRRRRRQRRARPRAQTSSSPLGKMLRIDPRAAATPGATRIPADNPFGTAVWAYGLRNPFRFSFDRGTGDLRDRRRRPGRARGDRLRAGSPAASAAAATTAGRAARARSPGPKTCTAGAAYIAPVFDYDSTAGTHAVTGGYVVRDPGLPTLRRPLRLRRLLRRRRSARSRSRRRARPTTAPTGLPTVREPRRPSARTPAGTSTSCRSTAAASSGSRTARPAPACSSRRRRRCPPPAAGRRRRRPGRARPHLAARADPGRAQGPRRPPRDAADRAHRERGLPRHDPRPPRRLGARCARAPRSAAAAARSSGSARRRRRSSASAARSAATSASRCACR